MTASLFLRMAAGITMLYFAGHTAGIPWTPCTDEGGASVIEAMKNHSFEVKGFQRTYWDFYFGFGVMISAFLFIQAVVLWQVASQARTDASRVRPMIVVFLVGFTVNAVMAWNYFFAVPGLMAAVIALCLGIALILANQNQSAALVYDCD